MADFGWAYVKGNLITGSAPPSGAVQYNDGNNNLAASADLIFISGSTSELNLTGNLNVIGEVSASVYYGDGSFLEGVEALPAGNDTNIQINGKGSFQGYDQLTFDPDNLILALTGALKINGSSKFGDSTDDTHIFTGSMEISTSANPLKLFGLQAGTPPNSSSYLALDSNYNLVLTSAAGGSGTISYSRRSVTTTITASILDTILGVTAGSNLEIRLPSAGDYTNGQYFTVKDEGGNSDIYSISILTSGSQTIDGQTSIILESPYAAVNIYSNGLDKFFIY